MEKVLDGFTGVGGNGDNGDQSSTMASTQAHHTTGWAAGIIAAALVIQAGAGGAYHVLTLLTVLAGLLGGTAPDWLEVAWWTRRRRLWITHRTWTHWGIAWIVLLYFSYRQLGISAWAPPLLGFAAGGVMHLIADWPNPLGVPWITMQRHSLKLWKSGRCDSIIVAASWFTAVWISDRVLFDGIHMARAMALVSAV